MPSKVNLDAIIRREDFEIQDNTNVSINKSSTFSIRDLEEDSFFLPVLRKPDFQRETNEWDSEKICDFIQSFLDGDLIPAIILWRSAGGTIFVIDGAHRISALAAWVHDDYGDGEYSKLFYDGVIPEKQIEVAEQTRIHIRKEIGAFKDYKLALKHPDKVDDKIVERSKSLGVSAIQLQWVEGNSEKAEASFFKINQQASPINPTELLLLKTRKKPNGIAARAIIRSGKGHKYWSAFSEENQSKIQTIAKDINDLLFTPILSYPIKTLDLPIAGSINSASSLSLIFNFVNIVNGIKIKNESTDSSSVAIKDEKNNDLEDDTNGIMTIEFLKKCRKVARRINSIHPSSLGLHPAVYFYSLNNGNHKTASFFAITSLILDFEKRDSYKDFIEVRDDFEKFLLKYDFFIPEIVRKHRSAMDSYEHLRDYFLLLIGKMLEGKAEDQIIDEIIKDSKFKYLKIEAEKKPESGDKEFSSGTKSAIFIKEALPKALRCKICNGFIHKSSISIDHIQRKEDGGMGLIDNAQLTHPYCNTTIKN